MRPEGLCQRKIRMTPSGNRTRDLPACSAVPQPTAPLRGTEFDDGKKLRQMAGHSIRICHTTRSFCFGLVSVALCYVCQQWVSQKIALNWKQDRQCAHDVTSSSSNPDEHNTGIPYVHLFTYQPYDSVIQFNSHQA